MARKTWPCSFSLPPALARDLNIVARRLGMSQSALLVELLTAPVGEMRRLLSSIPEVPSGEDIRRLRGQSVEIVQQRVAEAMAVIGDA